ncbi:MAG: hypothetical protein HQ559_07430 [Lentisphaerae bacterium]|nr:hypothetical protein [Lentisphaerota bacterium]
MTMLRVRCWLAFFSLLLLLGFCLDCPAQYARPGGAVRRPAATDEIVRIKRLTGLGGQSKVETPTYRTDVQRGAKPAKMWVRLTTTYDTAPEWIDELTLQYHAMAAKKEGPVTRYTIYKATVRCFDIEAGRGHASAVYLRPAALKRYGELVAVAVEITHDGKIVDSKSEISGLRLPPDWWKNPQVTDREGVTVKEGYLLNRAETPFAFVNVDDYEYVRFR